MLKLYFSIDTDPAKGYDCIKGTGYLTGKVIGFMK